MILALGSPGGLPRRAPDTAVHAGPRTAARDKDDWRRRSPIANKPLAPKILGGNASGISLL